MFINSLYVCVHLNIYRSMLKKNLYMFYNLIPPRPLIESPISRLFNLLLDNNVCSYIVRLLCYMYLNQNYCVKWNCKSSTDLCVSNGVKQGAVISPILFSSYMDALFE